MEIFCYFGRQPKKDPMIAKKTTKAIGYNVSGYDIPSTLGTFAQFYAVWYKEISYHGPRKRIGQYISSTKTF